MGRKHRSTRRRSQKAHNRRINRSKKYKSSGWKLKFYPNIFKAINYPPWIVRRDDKRFQ